MSEAATHFVLVEKSLASEFFFKELELMKSKYYLLDEYTNHRRKTKN
jgi:hypothetical protein